MCGIYAVIGLEDKKNDGIKNKIKSTTSSVAQKVIAGIKRIEYRGYDSWGICLLLPNKEALEVTKRVGQIGQVTEKIGAQNALAGIGHTRWATHGGVTQENAHPHLSNSGEFAVVHNGVIENYEELRQELEKTGYTFYSKTDSEVLVALYERAGGDAKEFKKQCARIEGRNAFVILDGKANALIAYRAGAPLYVGRNIKTSRGKGDVGAKTTRSAYYISSDVAALSSDVNEYALLPERELICLDATGPDQKLEFKPMMVTAQESELGSYHQYMEKEIFEQSQVLRAVLGSQETLPAWENCIRHIKKAKRVWLLGSGSAYFAAGQTGWYLKKAGMLAQTVPAYESESFADFVEESDVLVVFSQSGETADTNTVVEAWKKKGVFVVAVVNVVTSTLASLADVIFPLGVGTEIGVASTKALTAHMTWGWALAQLFGADDKQSIHTQNTNAITRLQNLLVDWLQNPQFVWQIKTVVAYIDRFSSVYILGKGEQYFAAFECALKLKEISYVHAEAFSAGELKHGVLALITKGTPVICLLGQSQTSGTVSNAISEVQARGGEVIGIGMAGHPLLERVNMSIHLPHIFDKAPELAQIVAVQRMTYELALKRGLNPDKPRNLAKSVTVL